MFPVLGDARQNQDLNLGWMQPLKEFQASSNRRPGGEDVIDKKHLLSADFRPWKQGYIIADLLSAELVLVALLEIRCLLQEATDFLS